MPGRCKAWHRVIEAQTARTISTAARGGGAGRHVADDHPVLEQFAQTFHAGGSARIRRAALMKGVFAADCVRERSID